MCGVAGLWRYDGATPDRAVLRRMTEALAHRGPDGEGFHLEPCIGLGHRRLAIVDVTGGEQPMWNEDGSAAVVFNGEIYNFPALRRDLESLGHVFRTRWDTEALVHAWEAWGPACLHRLDGMFAFALWDRRRGTLFLARDRLGKKPMHYATTSHGLAFASELAAFAATGVSRALDPAAVADFLAYGYVPDPATIFTSIRKLPPAHSLLLRVGAAAVPSPVRYWRPHVQPLRLNEEAASAELRARLREATEARLMADVPLGAFLSGGIDSGGVVATAAALRSERGEAPLDTFTIAFAGAEDETPAAGQVAARYGTVQHVEPAAAIKWIESSRAMAATFGEPFGDPSAVPTSHVCALARRHVTVALSGDGGDEAFAGYRRHRWHRLADGVRRHLSPGSRRAAFGTLAKIYPKLDRAPRWLRARHTLHELSLDSALGYARTVARVQQDQRRAVLAPSSRAALDGHDPHARIIALMEECGTDDPLAQAQYVDLATWLPGDILTKVDRAGMAHGLEVRSPLLAYPLVEWGLSLPAALKLHCGRGKHVLRRALEPMLPEDVLRRPKQGFATSLAIPLRAGAGRVRARLLDGPMQDCGLFDRAGVVRLLDEHESGRFDQAHGIWLLLAFEGFLAHEAGVAFPDLRRAA